MSAIFPDPDRAQIGLFVDALFRYADPGSHVALRAFRDDVDGVWNPSAWSRPAIPKIGLGPVVDAAVELAEACAAATEKVVFAPPVATFKSANGAAEKDIANGLDLMVECDAAPEKARERLENLLGPATVPVSSGGVWVDPETGMGQAKLHLHWRLTKPTRDFVDHVRLKEARRLAIILAGSDGTAVPLVHPLRWPGSWHRKSEPKLARIINLRAEAEIKLGEAFERLQEAVALIATPVQASPHQQHHSAGSGQGEALDVAAALAVIANDDLPWNEWIEIGLACCRATSGSQAGFSAFCAWSQKSAKFDYARTRDRWDHFATSPPDRIGAGTLFHMAREAFPGWMKPSDAGRAKRAAERLAAFEARHPPRDDDDRGLEPTLGPPAPRPILRVVAGELPAVVDAAEAILVERDRDLYEFGDQVVRPAQAPIKIADNQQTIGLRLVPVRLYHMIERFTRVIDFRKYSRVRQEWEPTDCPELLAKIYLERVAAWRVPKLSMITCCPMLLADGRIVERPGFDAASGVLFDPQGTHFPPVPARPTRDQARQALDTLTAPFTEFPFVDNAAKSVMWSALLSSVARPAFDFAPVHGFDAPAAGTGKSKLVDCCSVLVKGHECPVTSQGEDETEFEKRLGAELLEGNRLISVDNCERPLGGALLCQTATQHFLKIRVLGFSKTVTVTNGTLIFATGNNLKLYGDMLRRGLISRLDAGVERPELRTFTREDPVHVLKRERGRYAVAALTVLHAYNCAGRPGRQQPLGGFEGWSGLVRDGLMWLGEADPVGTIEAARNDDPDRQRLEAVITQWCNVLDNRSVTAREAIEEACWFDLTPTASNANHITYRHPEFRNALLDIANERGRVSAGRLGKWLSAHKLKVNGNYRLAADTLRLGNARWRIEERQTDGTWR